VPPKKPETAFIAYTGHSDFTKDDPPTFAIVGDQDGIASPTVMMQRVNAMKAAGIDTEFHIYKKEAPIKAGALVLCYVLLSLTKGFFLRL
jgi:hypothetical protein